MSPPTEMRNCQKTEKLQSATLARASTVSCENVKCNNNNKANDNCIATTAAAAAACSTSTATTTTTTTAIRRKGDDDRMLSSLPITILPPPSPPATFATDFSVAIEHCRREQHKEQNCCSSPSSSFAAIRICFFVQIAFLLLSTGFVFAQQQQLQQQQQQQQQQFSINNLNFYLRNNRKHNFSANREIVANSLSFSSDRMTATTTTTTTTTTNRSFLIDPFLSLIVDKKSNNFTNAADDDGAEDAASTGLAPSVDQEHSPRSVVAAAAADHRRFHFNESSSPFVEDSDNLMRLVMEGLGLERLPDYRKANISQKEYAAKYSEYLSRVYERQRREIQLLNSQPHQSGNPFAQIEWERANRPMHMMTFQHNATAAAAAATQYRQRRKRSATAAAAAPDEASEAIKFYSRQKNRIHLHFPLNIGADAIQAADIEEANVRLLLISSPALAAKSVRFAAKLSQRNQRNMKRKKKAKKRKKKKEKKKSKAPPTPPTPPPPPPPQRHILNMKVYQVLEPRGRLWLDGQKVDIEIDRSKGDETTSKWLEFDVTKAVEGWLLRNQTNLGLEIQCDNCYRNGARIIDDFSDDGGDGDGDDDDDEMMEDVEADDDIPSRHFDLAPVLNIIGRLGATHREKRSRHPSPPANAARRGEPKQATHNQHHNQHQHQQHHHHQTTASPPPAAAPRSKTNCYKDNQRCCRHAMDVVFKEIKGFEFIIQPKGFDAGYCRGRCPPRYNPAHHHALLQSLIWKQDHGKVPRPCCAPSKLMELEVLHVDEKDNEKLKISTWTDMRVLECACS